MTNTDERGNAWTLEELLADLDRADNLYLTPKMCADLAKHLRHAGPASPVYFATDKEDRQQIEFLRAELKWQVGCTAQAVEPRQIDALCDLALKWLDARSHAQDSGSVGPWKECVYKHPGAPISADTKRLDFLEGVRATVYSAITSTHWVFVDERRPAHRKGIIGKTLREAIDAAISGTPATTRGNK